MSKFPSRFADCAVNELERWKNGAGKETKKPYSDYVGEYWKSIGIDHLDGATIQDGIRPAWSSAFVSFCARRAQAGTGFKYTQAHCHYVKAAMDAADGLSPFGFIARRFEDYPPKVGDIVVGGREYASAYTFDQAKLAYLADTFYPSHGDIVTGVSTKHLVAIGGNVSNNVDQKRLATVNGKLKPRLKRGRHYPWIAVLECVI